MRSYLVEQFAVKDGDEGVGEGEHFFELRGLLLWRQAICAPASKQVLFIGSQFAAD